LPKNSKLPVATMKPFSVSLKLSIPTPPPSKTIQSAAIQTLEELPSAYSKVEINNSLLSSINNNQILNYNNQVNKVQFYSEGDKSTSDTKNKKQNFFLIDEEPLYINSINLTKFNYAQPTKLAEISGQFDVNKKASEQNLLKYIKNLVKEASMEKITQTLG
jgi:hypothetical protein